MRRHFRYIFFQLVGPVVVIVLTLAGVIWLTQSLRLVDLIVNKGLSLGFFLYLTLLMLPWLLTIILPVALFAAILYAYHRLNGDSELMVLKAAGLSNLAVAAPALAMAVVVTIVGYAINLYFMPNGFRAFKDLQAEIRESFAAVLLQEGVFNTPVEGLTIYVRERHSTGELRGILVHDNRDTLKPVTLMAERGALLSGEGGPSFVLENGNRQEVELEDGRLALLYFDSYVFEFADTAAIGASRFREPEERYLYDLFFPDDVVEDRHRREFMAEGHKRLTSPLYTLVFAVIGLGAILSGQFSRRGQHWRLAVAVGATIVLEAGSFGLASAVVNTPLLIPLMYLLPVMVILVGLRILSEDRTRVPRATPKRAIARAMTGHSGDSF